jgi:hypothetical protein
VTVSFVPSAGVADPTPLRLLTNGEPEPDIDEARASVILAEEDLEVVIDLGEKDGAEARVWTCDFSHVSGGAGQGCLEAGVDAQEYVTINGDVSMGWVAALPQSAMSALVGPTGCGQS